MNIRVSVLIACLLTLTGIVRANDDLAKKRKSAAQQMVKDIGRLALHKIYVPNFSDTSGRQSDAGFYFAASFSNLLSEKQEGFVVISRIDAHRYLHKSGWTDSDLSNAGVLSKLISEFGPDGILWGTVSSSQNEFTIDFTLCDPLGKELLRTQYKEKPDRNLSAIFPVGTDTSGRDFYIAGLDGVSAPGCVYCPNPSYPDDKRRDRVAGTILLSVLITVEGRADQIRIVKKLDPDLDRDAIEKVKSWRFKPAKDPDGALVPVRVQIEISFRLC